MGVSVCLPLLSVYLSVSLFFLSSSVHLSVSMLLSLCLLPMSMFTTYFCSWGCVCVCVCMYRYTSTSMFLKM